MLRTLQLGNAVQDLCGSCLWSKLVTRSQPTSADYLMVSTQCGLCRGGTPVHLVEPDKSASNLFSGKDTNGLTQAAFAEAFAKAQLCFGSRHPPELEAADVKAMPAPGAHGWGKRTWPTESKRAPHLTVSAQGTLKQQPQNFVAINWLLRLFFTLVLDIHTHTCKHVCCLLLFAINCRTSQAGCKQI